MNDNSARSSGAELQHHYANYSPWNEQIPSLGSTLAVQEMGHTIYYVSRFTTILTRSQTTMKEASFGQQGPNRKLFKDGIPHSSRQQCHRQVGLASHQSHSLSKATKPTVKYPASTHSKCPPSNFVTCEKKYALYIFYICEIDDLTSTDPPILSRRLFGILQLSATRNLVVLASELWRKTIYTPHRSWKPEKTLKMHSGIQTLQQYEDIIQKHIFIFSNAAEKVLQNMGTEIVCIPKAARF